MGGFMGFGQSGGEKNSTAGINSVFNYALPTAKANEAAGSSALGTAADYFTKLLMGGRTQAAQNAAPAVNAATAQADTAKRQEAEQGTNRGGGTAAANREASTTTQASIDDIINQSLVGGRAAGAAGLTSIGGTRLAAGNQELATGQQGQEALYTGAINKEGAQGADFSRIISSLI